MVLQQRTNRAHVWLHPTISTVVITYSLSLTISIEGEEIWVGSAEAHVTRTCDISSAPDSGLWPPYLKTKVPEMGVHCETVVDLKHPQPGQS
jgi:hypothetical protein